MLLTFVFSSTKYIFSNSSLLGGDDVDLSAVIIVSANSADVEVR